MQVAVLGSVRAQRDGVPVSLGAPKQRALLAALALHAGRPVSSDALVDLLWGDAAPPAAIASLQTYVAGLRRALEPWRPGRSPSVVLPATRQGYSLALPEEAVDATRFGATVDRVHRRLAGPTDPIPRLPRDLGRAQLELIREELAAALGDWSGQPFADLRAADAVVAERARLEELRLVAREDHALVRLALGEQAAVAADLGSLVREFPLRESLCALWVLALARSGRQGEALDALRGTRRTLADELGIDPGPGLRAVEAAVLSQSPELDTWPTTRAAVPPPARPTKAPRPTEGGGWDWPLVGRRSELDVLDQLLTAALEGRPGVAVLDGEPGVGKSRLLLEVAARGAVHGFAVLTGRCSQDEGAPPLWPWTRVLRDLAEAIPAEGNGPHLDLASGVGLGTPPGGGFGTGDAQFALWEAVAVRLATASAQRPLLILLDDLHWADSSSLKLLRHVVTSIRHAPVLIVAARRRLPEPSGALVEVGEALARHGAVRLPLAGLDTDEVRTLIRSATGREPDTSEARALRDRTDGNPFFLIELVRLGPTGSTQVPAAVTDVVAARVSRLPEPTQQLLRACAVIGRLFDTTLVTAIYGAPADGVLDALDPAIAVGLVVEEGPDRFRFSHALVRDALYEGIPPTRRARRHADVAQALEAGRSLADGSAAARSKAVHHWLAAGPAHTRRAWQAAAAAAREATGLYGWDEAAELLTAGMAAQRSDEHATALERYQLLLALADACRWSGDRVGRDAALLEAIEEADRLGDVELIARAAIGTVDGTVWHPHGRVQPRFVTALRDALRRLPERDSELRCRVMLALAAELYFVDPPPEREALVEQGLAMARRLDDPPLLVWAAWRPSSRRGDRTRRRRAGVSRPRR